MPERAQSCDVPSRGLHFELSGIDFSGGFARDLDRVLRGALKSVTLVTADRGVEDKLSNWLFEGTPADAFITTRLAKFTLERSVPGNVTSNGQGVSVTLNFERSLMTEAPPDPFEDL